MWLKILYEDDDIEKWPFDPKKITCLITNDKVAPIDNEKKTFRISPIFPLNSKTKIKSLTNCTIYFFNYENAYRVLGKIQKDGERSLKDCVFISCGLSSIILIVNDRKFVNQFRKLSPQKEYAYEKWVVKNSKIQSIKYKVENSSKIRFEKLKIHPYKILPLTERAIVDEFKATIKLLLLKLTTHMPFELPKIRRLIAEVNDLITELTFLESLKGKIPESLSEYTLNDLKNHGVNQVIKHQNIDRILQINSALSYVSTQAFSGAIPILERRSLVRRNSLLGIGSAILALNNLARFIEGSFSKIDFSSLITTHMKTAAPLKGTERLPEYNSNDWFEGSVNIFAHITKPETSYFKMPYFSGRLGYRETEYSIAAAIQSISSGASLEWSLMTLTHEMLHGHVRTIIASIFEGSEKLKVEDLRDSFYETFKKNVHKKETSEKLIDSIRNTIFTYCCNTIAMGSLTSKKPYVTTKLEFKLPKKELLWSIFEVENRNINEIFVHILDLNYFYANRISVYIPLIWCSWAAVPHIKGDLRQYILRSLLTISSKYVGSLHYRFNTSVSVLKELLERHSTGKLKHPIIQDVIRILGDDEILNRYYFPGFKASVIMVDLAKHVFVSSDIKSSLFNDKYVTWESGEKDEYSIEDIFKYSLPTGFNDVSIQSPFAYLLDYMIKVLYNEVEITDLEKETVFQFLALNSNN